MRNLLEKNMNKDDDKLEELYVNLNDSVEKKSESGGNKKGTALMIGLIALLSILVIALVIVIASIIIKGIKDGGTDPKPTSVPSVTDVPKENDDNKTEEPTKAPENKGTGYTINAGKYTITYNYSEGDTKLPRIKVANATVKTEFNWDADISMSAVELFKMLKPEIGDFIGNGREQLAISIGEKAGTAANTVHVIDGTTLSEYVFTDTTFTNPLTLGKVSEKNGKIIAELKDKDHTYMVQVDNKNASSLSLSDNVMTGLVRGKLALRKQVLIDGEGIIGEIVMPASIKAGYTVEANSGTFFLYSDDDYSGDSNQAKALSASDSLKKRIAVTKPSGENLLAEIRTSVPENRNNLTVKVDEKKRIGLYNEAGEKVSLTGVDVSKWDGSIDWKKAKNDGIEFAMIRVGNRGTGSTGKINLDPEFKNNVVNATEAGIKAGVYFFSQAITVDEAKEEAKFVINNIKNYNITFPVAFDTQYYTNARANNLSNELRTKIAKAFCEEIKKAGYTPVIYCSTDWSMLNLDLEALTDFDIWHALYNTKTYYPYEFNIWEYSDKGSVNGFEGDVAMNVSFKDYSVK